MTATNPLPDLDADWRAIRRLNDAIAESVGNTVQALVDEFDLKIDDDTYDALCDYVTDLATQGKATWPV